MLTTQEKKEQSKIIAKQWKLNNPKKVWATKARQDAKARSKEKNIPFDVTATYLQSLLTDTCPVYGTEFKWIGNGTTLSTSPSLDRINPDLGYVEGNIVVISIKANRIKSAYKAADLYKVADWLYEIENKG
jgi:hypothetical protein